MRTGTRSLMWTCLLLPACAPAASPVSTPTPTAEPAALLESPGPTTSSVESGSDRSRPPEVVPLPQPTVTDPVPSHRDCDDREEHRLCVSPAETTGALVGKGPCREAPKQAVCRSCRPVYAGTSEGKCCYRGLSRLPACD